MFFQSMIDNAQLFFLVFARIMAMLMIAPLFSSSSFPAVGRVGLALLTAVAVFPSALELGYPVPLDNGLAWVLLLVGEALVGLVMAFFLVVLFSAFQIAGQFFSIQMGFGASQVFDPMAQVQIPLMGQFFNLMALYVFVSIDGLSRLFFIAFGRSFQVLTAGELLLHPDFVSTFLLKAFTGLFAQALVMALPIVGTLLLVSVTTGLLAKAAPQMNLLMIGFPIQISVAFTIIILCSPLIVEFSAAVINWGMHSLELMIGQAGGGLP